jgi:hypothetical protein
MVLLHDHAAQVHYPPGDVRTHRATEIQTQADLLHALAHGHFEYDCSQVVEILWRVVGLHIPPGTVNGYTGSMLACLPVYENPAAARIGAAPVFGPATGEHTSMVMEPGDDPLLFSHGRPGVDLLRLSVERTWHAPPVRVCSIADL